MSWRNVRLIFGREIRDQLRDRRTLFMIAVLPLLLYPLLGMSVFQLAQFLRHSEPKVLVLGRAALAENTDLPPLFDKEHGGFALDLYDEAADAGGLTVEFAGDSGANEEATALAEQRLKSGDVQVVLHFPADFGERLNELRKKIESRAGDSDVNETAIPLIITNNSAKEKSRVARRQVEHVLTAWRAQITRDNLLAGRVPANVAKPFELASQDVAELRQQQALVWSKILPFVLFIWALTGAFNPAVDLCAGEKERGTLETLLSSPALRSEIVWGKLLTVMAFSAATALLNLASLGITAQYIISQLRSLPFSEAGNASDLPPLVSTLWLVVALVPMSALFSALCLACAAFARSTKEGQYYLMPLLLVTMPLMILPMAPGAELNLGNSLIPITGLVLLIMNLLQANYMDSLPYVVPVCGVTAICCHCAIRWAVYQFNQESVLFRESERLDLRRWIVHLVRDRRETPSLAEAFFCVTLMFVLQFFMQLAISANMPAAPDFRFLTLLVFISQVVCFALPALLMALMLTGNPRKTLLLDRVPNPIGCAIAIVLAVLLHPVGVQLGYWIRELYPVQNEGPMKELFEQMFKTAPYAWLPYAMLALLPAFCEELAFRGFVLSGLRHFGSKWWAIGLSAVFFGMAHQIVQQSMGAVVLGLVIGYIAVQTGSLVPGMLFHMTYNSIMFAVPSLVERWPQLREVLYEPGAEPMLYHWSLVAACGLAAIVPFWWLHRLPYQATREERLSELRARQTHHPLPAAAHD